MNRNKLLPVCWPAALLSLLLLSGCQPQEAPMAYGTLERERIQLLATAAEQVVKLHRQKGEQVQRGDLLLELDSTAQQYRVARAQAELARLQAALSEAKNGSRPEQILAAEATVGKASVSLADARRQLNRAKALRQQNLLAQAGLEQAELNVRLASDELAAQQQRLNELRNGVRSEQIRQAEQAVASAGQNVLLEQKALADLRIIASRDGVLEDLPYQPGERVQQGAVLAVLAAGQSAYARIYLPQTALAQTRLGQQVSLQVDGQRAPLQGTIRFIAHEASFTPYYALNQHERSRLMFLTEISVSADTQLPSGLPVQLMLSELQP